MLLILFIIEFSIVGIFMGGAWGNQSRPFVNVYLIMNAVVLHMLAWIAFFIHNKLILRICMPIMIGLAILNVQYVLIICAGGLFFPYGFGFPFTMVTWYNEACIGPTARNWHMDGVILNFFSYIIFSFGMHKYTIFKKKK